MARVNVNGNYHSIYEWFNKYVSLASLGIRYLGDGRWGLPQGASVEGGHDDDWVITLEGGAEIHVYTEEE